ncbi:hypothetical protein D3C72_1064790 [compost metagenome]
MQEDQQDRGEDADLFIGRQDADQGGRQPHDHNGGEECFFASKQVAEPTEYDGAHGADCEAGAERCQAGEQSGCLVTFGKEQRAKEDRQASVQVEVIPFKYGTQRRA